MNRALFLDRDGVINEDYGYVHKIEDFHFREGIFDVCRAAQKARMKIIVVTNQAGIGRGYYSISQYNLLTSYMLDKFNSLSIRISSVYHCPFHPQHGEGHYKTNSYDRKPNPGMLLKACNDNDINPFASIMIGDNISDKKASESAGIRNYVSARNTLWAQEAIYSIQMLS